MLIEFTGAVVAQTEPGEPFGSPITLPPELQAKINETDVEKYKTEYLEQFKKKCEQNGHPELFEQAQVSYFLHFCNYFLLLPSIPTSPLQ